MVIHGRQKGPKTAIFPDALFLRFLHVLPTFSDMGPIPNAQKGACLPEVRPTKHSVSFWENELVRSVRIQLWHRDLFSRALRCSTF